ncbi:helix-turn-helix domain-containing protein [Lentzea tibetensis]|uniref:Helix-turn-helix domain-containing protein n=1 Tax=Lentzea tibetensis TaxID=2591470 RepID=A0A563EJ87_9PSEU|nr:helix-turn-helix domain-containing protein [Lentzea tibetensis]
MVVVGYDGAALLDMAGPIEVFQGANFGVAPRYRVTVASLGGGPITVTAGVQISAHADLADVDEADTLIVAGGWGYGEAARTPELCAHVKRIAARARRVAGICTGSLVLAETGLLKGRKATTHWAFLDELETSGADVDRDAIFVADGNVVTSAGVTAGIDLSLAMIEQDHGAALARRIAQYLVVFLQRPGGQSQFSVRSRLQPVRDDALRGLLDEITNDPARDWTVPAMARRAAMSTRHFARLFPQHVGVSPAQYVERARVEVATELLTGSEPLDTVARRSGFGSAETMRRAFLRVLGVPPGSYRARFQTTGVA